MATVIPFRRARTVTASATHTRIPKWIGPWFRRHLRSVLLVTGLLVVIGIVMALNLSGWPGRINDDEGTYVSQAWAVEYWKELAHYTYWYDHPPLGWILIAGYAVLTNGFERVDTALTIGREFMLITSLISAGVMYILARRVGLSRTFSSIAVVLFAVSPVSLHYHRMVFLDNLAVMFTLAAFAFAASPKKSIAAAAGAGFTFAMAMLCKETIAILFPALVWILIQHTVKGSRKWNGPILFGVSFLFGFQYILFATLKNELLHGPGHVSLEDALVWQLHGRPGSGSLLDPESGAFGLARSWVSEADRRRIDTDRIRYQKAPTDSSSPTDTDPHDVQDRLYAVSIRHCPFAVRGIAHRRDCWQGLGCQATRWLSTVQPLSCEECSC
jgi:hypothetical protein